MPMNINGWVIITSNYHESVYTHTHVKRHLLSIQSRMGWLLYFEPMKHLFVQKRMEI